MAVYKGLVRRHVLGNSPSPSTTDTYRLLPLIQTHTQLSPVCIHTLFLFYHPSPVHRHPSIMRTTVNLSVVLLALATWATAMPTFNPSKPEPMRARSRSLSLPPPYFPWHGLISFLYILSFQLHMLPRLVIWLLLLEGSDRNRVLHIPTSPSGGSSPVVCSHAVAIVSPLRTIPLFLFFSYFLSGVQLGREAGGERGRAGVGTGAQ
jgi:hypothetical protein